MISPDCLSARFRGTSITSLDTPSFTTRQHGRTDELGFHAVENRHYVTDIHATVMHQLGIDHERFTFRAQGLDFKLTGVEPTKVVTDILA